MLRPLLYILALALAPAASGAAARAHPPALRHQDQMGYASFYASDLHGRRTASGTRYDELKYTAAHRTLPFGTRVRVTNLANSKSIVVTITDRGPVPRDRIIDVSRRAAFKLGFERQGLTKVRLKVVRG